MTTVPLHGSIRSLFSVRGWLLLAFTVAALAVPVSTAGACSCVGGDPRAALSRADAAFVGTVISRREVPGAGWPRAVEYVFAVETSYKGALGDTVAVRTSDNEASCGLSLRDGERTGLLLREQGRGWSAGLCDVMDPADLERASRPFPSGSESGVAHLLVTGPFHDAGLAALDRRGELIGWAFGSEGDVVSVCPGGRYAVQAGDFMSVIRLRDLRVVRARALPDDWSHAVRCLGRRGRDVVAVTFPFGTGSERQTLVRLRDGALHTIGKVDAVRAVLGRTAAYFALARPRNAAPIAAISYRDGGRRSVGPAGRSADSIALSPDERHIAAIAGHPRQRLQVTDLLSGRTRSRRVDVEWTAPVWLDSTRLAVPGPRGRSAVFDLDLRRVGALPGWDTAVTAVAGGRLWWVTRGGGVRWIDTRTGARVAAAGRLLAGAAGLDAIPRPRRITRAPSRAPRPAVASAASCTVR